MDERRRTKDDGQRAPSDGKSSPCLWQGELTTVIRSLKKFIFRYQYLVEIYSVSAEKIITDAFSYSENV